MEGTCELGPEASMCLAFLGTVSGQIWMFNHERSWLQLSHVPAELSQGKGNGPGGFTSSQKTSENTGVQLVLCLLRPMPRAYHVFRLQPVVSPTRWSLSHLTRCVMSPFTQYVDSVFPILSACVGPQRQPFKGVHTHACTHNHHPHRHIKCFLQPIPLFLIKS